jgi:hypothetical protein
MTIYNQLSAIPVPGGDLVVKNYGLTDIAAGQGVLFDGTNMGTADSPIGVVAVTGGAGRAKTAGVLVETLYAGKTGRLRIFGGAVAVANTTLAPGDVVMLDDTASGNHEGQVIVATTTSEILGKCLSSASAGDPVLVWVCPVAVRV